LSNPHIDLPVLSTDLLAQLASRPALKRLPNEFLIKLILKFAFNYKLIE
jgi:hypothetical protein